jgi:hypothetical protein
MAEEEIIMRSSIYVENETTRFMITPMDDHLAITISNQFDRLVEIQLTTEKLELRYFSANGSLPIEPNEEITLLSLLERTAQR